MYVKIFDSIIKSSVWDTDPETRITWITCLLLCDQNGNFTATRKYIAREANLPQDRVDAALDLLLAPDIDSTTPDECGRRLDYCGNNTWHVVNYQKYNELAKAETVREQTRARVRNFKQRAAAEPGVTTVTVTQGNAEVTQGNAPVTVGNEKVTPLTIPVATDSSPTPSISPVPGDGEKQASPEPEKKLKPEPVQLNRETLNLDNLTVARLEAWTRDYPGVDIDTELAAINTWCKTATAKALKIKRWSQFIDIWLQKALADKVTRPRPQQQPPQPPKPTPLSIGPSSAFDWPATKKILESTLEPDLCARWIEPLTYEGMSEKGAVLVAADQYAANQISYNLRESISDAILLAHGIAVPFCCLSRSDFGRCRRGTEGC